MNSTSVSALIFLLLSISSHELQSEEIVLSPGDSVAHQFSSLPPFGEAIGGEIIGQGGVHLRLSGDPFDQQDTLQVEFYQSGIHGKLIKTRTYKADGINRDRIMLNEPGIWQDLRGAFRITMVSGSISIAEAAVVVTRYIPFNRGELYGQVVALTEQSSPLLRITLEGPSVLVQWPLVLSNSVLEAIGSISTGETWSVVTNVPSIVEGEFVITNSLSGPGRFYRLRKG